ncbi:MAG: prenyltransferase [Salinirussus sp.]
MTEAPIQATGPRDLGAIAEYVHQTQQANGLIPWYPDGPADPWNHVESAMGLTVGGQYAAAQNAYSWLADTQLDDGSWWGEYEDGVPTAHHRETHRIAYVATGVWHYFRATDDQNFLECLWPTVERALDFVIDHQQTTGEVPWAVSATGDVYEAALVTGCSSLAMSLLCGWRIATALGRPRPGWRRAWARLREAIRRPSSALDTRWLDKSSFAMDWFYPVLAGAVTGQAAAERLAAEEATFIEPGLGCRCDRTEPWVTVAETAELALAMLAVGRRSRAATLLSWTRRFRTADDAYWTGYQFADDELWPVERPTWTAGAVLLAADALCGHTPAADLFTAQQSIPSHP